MYANYDDVHSDKMKHLPKGIWKIHETCFTRKEKLAGIWDTGLENFLWQHRRDESSRSQNSI